MAWKESCPMTERTKFIGDYLKNIYTITELCQYYNISRKTGYKWIERFEKYGPEGLSDRSTAPLYHPHAVSDIVLRAIIGAREKHPRWGPKKLISWLSSRDPSLKLPAPSTVGDILKRHGLVRGRRRRRKVDLYTKPLCEVSEPNNLWCMDFKGEFRTKDLKYCYPLTTTDSYSRYLIKCNGLHNTRTEGAYPIVKAAFREFGLPDAILTDNGSPFASKAPQGLSRLSIWWLKLGIRHERIVPGHPEQNGRHERMHRTLKDETTKPAANTLRSQQRRFDAFRYEYNNERPHEALGQTPPGLHYCPSTKPYPARIRAFEYPDGAEIKQVHQSGRIRWKSHLIFLSITLGGEKLALLKTSDGFWNVLFGPLTLGILDQKRLDLGLIRITQ